MQKTKNGEYEELLRACGGFGGARGNNGSGGAGGKGGAYSNKYLPRTKLYNCTICKKISGGNGGSPSSSTENGMINAALNFEIYFGKATPPSDNSNFCLKRSYNAISTTHNGNVTKDVDVAGGHSFGDGLNSGGTKGTNPVNGGGGACNQSGGRDGAGGYFGLYY